ncbi:MAG: LemA family protein [Planctomycetota bacterium]|nr:LemA family protein [Planctomycetota bacterium]MDA1261707.1 LemA family protein [Planctomycetota bacterium]
MVPIFVSVLVVLLIPLIWGIAIYNRLVRGRVRAENGLSQIDVQLKRRCDLIPNLVEAVKGYMAHERQTLEAVIAARNSAVAGLQSLGANPRNALAIQSVAGASGQLDQLLMSLRVSIENYPDLKASTNVLGLQEELTSTENRIAFSRQAYNDAVMVFNTNIAVFPSNFVAALLGFSQLTLFEANDADRVLPEVKF